ncbi:MAG TPA: nucleoside permease [Prolixibacteraceae bacterium]|nr:nucleoside permease [Prolixibacteraceae bacterium]HPS11714.1 nucleoside permease [Prolixibacteraceae bacterium]
MGIKSRLTIMNFLQFFIWGCWLISLSGYLINNLGFTGFQVGSIYATAGIASLFMPGLLGIVADRWFNAEKVLGVCHLIGAGLFFWASTVTNYDVLYWIMLFYAMAYMPTIALNNSVAYYLLEKRGHDVVKEFPPIRVWGTVGFIVAMWIVDLFGLKEGPGQFYLSAVASLLLGVYTLFLPQCKPDKSQRKKTIVSALGLDALVLFKNPKMAIFFVFSMLLGAALQITNTFGQPFLLDFKTNYASSFAVTHPGILMSISQISETLFILAIPFFMKKFGIRNVMLISMFAWVLRFGLFGLGNPGSGFVLLILSMIIYGMAFDFFNISGSLFVEMEINKSIRSSAQGLFMIMTNGIGTIIGGLLSGWVVDHFTVDGVKNWPSIWFSFAAYALLLGILFPFFFKYKHNPDKMKGSVVH